MKESRVRCQHASHICHLGFSIFVCLTRRYLEPVSPGMHRFPGGSQVPYGMVDLTLWVTHWCSFVQAVTRCVARILSSQKQTAWLAGICCSSTPHCFLINHRETSKARRADGGERRTGGLRSPCSMLSLHCQAVRRRRQRNTPKMSFPGCMACDGEKQMLG